MKKVFMMIAVAAFFSMSATSCAGEEKAEEGTENAEGGDHAEGDHAEDAH